MEKIIVMNTKIMMMRIIRGTALLMITKNKSDENNYYKIRMRVIMIKQESNRSNDRGEKYNRNDNYNYNEIDFFST